VNGLDGFNQSMSGAVEGERIYGVVVGIVTSNTLDAMGRLEVRFPGSSDTDIGHLARLATLMAGNGYGTFFLPQVNDEVLVAFECGDITRPYVIGALWNGQDKPPDTNANSQNNLRFIKSRSGHLVRLDDTDGAEKIEIIDKSGGNSITIDTARNTITIKAAQDILITAAQGTIKLDAQNVEIVSSAATGVQARGGLTLDGSPGDTTIKGAMVNIN
jgi:uncharacterized protein involved in type VI secretion and phage assembly